MTLSPSLPHTFRALGSFALVTVLSPWAVRAASSAAASSPTPATATAAPAAATAAAPNAGAAARYAVPPPTDPSALQVAAGFKVELVYTVPKADQGSWVALTLDGKGRLIASDQYGGLYRLTLPPLGDSSAPKVEHLAIDFNAGTFAPLHSAEFHLEPPPPPKAGEPVVEQPKVQVGAHGLLYAFDSLYVMVNEGKNHSGLWRVRDTDGDDQYDKIEYLRAMKGSGEHGPHALVLSPDGKSIYFTNGNHTDLPLGYEKTRSVAWGEDHLLPRMWDARGHARNKYAPGGYIGRTDPEGKSIEIFTTGFRNDYDIAFDQNGELFAYDSDMEWDIGSPWYVPTRINHAVDGGDFGWRSGAGRWPDYYIDSLPAVVNLGPGSPTGTTFGTNAKFPARYQQALFACDWTYGTMYAIHFTPEASTFKGRAEEFVSGKPLPLTDVVINPRDGAMYFAVGGRRTESALYRVTYVGKESTAPAKLAAPTKEAKLRRSLEALHAPGTGPDAIATAWPELNNSDRFIRFAARAAIERQPAAQWSERALAEKRPWASIEALVALARVGDKSLQPQLIAALEKLDVAHIRAELRLPLLRAWELAFTRMGKPDAATCARLVAEFDPMFPHKDPFASRELESLLIFLDAPNVVAKTVPLLNVAEPAIDPEDQVGSAALRARNGGYGAVGNAMSSSRPDRQQIAYAYALRNATVGWTPELRASYFGWFNRTRTWKGGASFGGFLENIRTEALDHVGADPTERATLDARSKRPPVAAFANAVSAKGPGETYTIESATALLQNQLSNRNFAQGKAMFTAAACIICHKFNDDGGGIGPDLTGSGNRYSVRDLMENIIDPSLVVSDQYASERVETRDGKVVIGRVVEEADGQLLVMANPFAPAERVKVKAADVTSRSTFKQSMMPPGLINALNKDELRDLTAYILSGGNAADPKFYKAP